MKSSAPRALAKWQRSESVGYLSFSRVKTTRTPLMFSFTRRPTSLATASVMVFSLERRPSQPVSWPPWPGSITHVTLRAPIANTGTRQSKINAMRFILFYSFYGGKDNKNHKRQAFITYLFAYKL